MKQPLQLIKISGQAGASAAGTVIAELPLGFRYYAITQNMTVPTATSVTGVNFPGDTILRVNGQAQRSINPAELDGINILNNPPSATIGTAGATPFSTIAPITTLLLLEQYLAEPWAPIPSTRERYALDLLPGDSGSLEVPFASIAAAPTVTFCALVEPISEVVGSGRPLNRFGAQYDRNTTVDDILAQKVNNGKPTLVKHLKGSDTPNSSTFNMQKIHTTFGNNDVLQHLRLMDPTGGQTIDQAVLTLTRNAQTRELFNRTRYQNIKDLRTAQMNPTVATFVALSSTTQGSAFDIVPNMSDEKRDGWAIAPTDTFNVALTFSASATTAIKWIAQVFGPCN